MYSIEGAAWKARGRRVGVEGYNARVDREAVAAKLKRMAIDLGFDRAGIARLGTPAHADAFRGWLDRGDAAGMSYLRERAEERLRPELLLDGARSALCVAQQYAPTGEATTGDLWPRVARYARGRDYHNSMGQRLRRLAARIREAFPGCRTRTGVDTAPILERELAAAAGLGVFGKNTNLLHPQGGSWFLLGEVLLTLDLAPDRPLADLCGSCTACLDACPTGALPEPYRLDSNRCISYWTIEHRGAIPIELRESIGDWVFGCDICQEVCPVNSPASCDNPEFEIAEARRDLDLIGLLTLDEEGYRARFRASAMQRSRRDGLRRNAAVAMGNRRQERYVEALSSALDDGSEVVREHAAWALECIDSPAARRALGKAGALDRNHPAS